MLSPHQWSSVPSLQASSKQKYHTGACEYLLKCLQGCIVYWDTEVSSLMSVVAMHVSACRIMGSRPRSPAELRVSWTLGRGTPQELMSSCCTVSSMRLGQVDSMAPHRAHRRGDDTLEAPWTIYQMRTLILHPTTCIFGTVKYLGVAHWLASRPLKSIVCQLGAHNNMVHYMMQSASKLYKVFWVVFKLGEQWTAPHCRRSTPLDLITHLSGQSPLQPTWLEVMCQTN